MASNIRSQSSHHSFMDYSDDIHANLPGVIVPQAAYVPQHGQMVNPPLPSIRFVHNNIPAIRLRDALASPNLPGLRGARTAPTLSNTGMRVTLRIHWPGYPNWRQENGIDLFDHTYQANPLTFERIAHKVARLVKMFYDDMQHNVGTEPSWQLQGIPFDNLYLVELRHVSRGSWQPVICWNP
ncbi:uncharacterized protein PHACADRAFT_211921 [Phanerochaete carnosa HHB-10118-sp]|uniref:Uncharacterized protein n=1 Tax=Phanerochaete carnosa (strain HHB-10118-sp) TaxID=650164 RepID=K5WQR0_PHACS|nr:uncharacterized protein PHACADRAFT_211921 [Phanerochaete carnosa HHB-10118-sp]EKM52702.1 hypothetical protein PHACADRAFT_211921 [Phanerochaete carnosa HHB-10118-sp]